MLHDLLVVESLTLFTDFGLEVLAFVQQLLVSFLAPALQVLLSHLSVVHQLCLKLDVWIPLRPHSRVGEEARLETGFLSQSLLLLLLMLLLQPLLLLSVHLSLFMQSCPNVFSSSILSPLASRMGSLQPKSYQSRPMIQLALAHRPRLKVVQRLLFSPLVFYVWIARRASSGQGFLWRLFVLVLRLTIQLMLLHV